jgi:hypothetical protein
MFALTIGINDYVNVTPLGGCVADANAMVAFLKETLGVPPENITSLRNKQATREAIENAIAALAEDERIQKGDPIVIFYAGHGAEAPSPPGWSTYGKIQMLVPVDFVPEATGDKKRGQGVLDVKLGHLLQQLAEKKGDNIVRDLSFISLFDINMTKTSRSYSIVVTLAPELGMMRLIHPM